jgi:peptide/nickel transport system permease protein
MGRVGAKPSGPMVPVVEGSVSVMTTMEKGSERPGEPSADERVAEPDGPRRGPRARLRGSVLGVVLHRLLVSIPLFFVVTAFSFVLVSLAPGDPAASILGADAAPELYARLREQLGLNLPIYEQYWHWLTHALTGDFGSSIYTGESVTDAMQNRLPVTLSLIGGAFLLSVVLGVTMGVFSAVRGGAAGRIVDGLSMLAFSLPSFWLGAVLIGLFAVRLGWFPATGYVPFAESPTKWFLCLVLPVTALGAHTLAAIARQTREAMLDVLDSEFIRIARANGVSSSSLVFRHALKNAGIRVVTILGLATIGLLGGTVIVESVFAMPGLGGMAVEATIRKDLPVIQGVVAVFTLMVIVINLVVDLAYTVLNPRVVVR